MTIFDGARDLDIDRLFAGGGVKRPARTRRHHDWRGAWRLYGPLLPGAAALGMIAGSILAVVLQ